MLLSICMMVKDEEKNLNRCLKSLTPILNGIDSELVIVDTGSKDSTVEIAKKYTEKVYFHEWSNNFSEMRNITISYAKGEWILIIDADEFFENCDQVIVFLNSKYINKYSCCNLSVKSIINEKENDYTVFSSPRIFKNDGYFHYNGTIHNDPIFKGQIMTLDTILIHTGYIATDKELMERKFKRTSSMLNEELKKNPNNLYYRYQLSVSYSMHKDFKEALEQIEKTYKIFSEEKLSKKDYIYIYYQLAICNLQFDDMENYKKAEKYCIEGIEVENEHIDLYFCLAKAYMLLNRYEEAIDQYVKYFKLIDNYENLNIRYNGLIEVYSMNRLQEAYYDISIAYFKLYNYKNCITYINKINIQKYIEKVTPFAITAFINEADFNNFRKFYNKVIKIFDKDSMQSFLNSLEDYIMKFNKESYMDYLNYFSEGNDTYCYLNKIRKMYENNEHNYGSMITEFVNQFPLSDQPSYFGDFIYFKIKIGEDIYDMMSKVSISKVEEFIVYIANKYSDFSEVVYNYVIKNMGSDFHIMRVNRLIERFILVLDKLNRNEYKIIFEDYIKCGTNYILKVYNNEMLDERIIYDVKNNEDVFFIFMNQANEIKHYDEEEYIRYLRKALAVYPFMKNGIEMLLNDLKNEINETNDEFENYKIKVKNTIKALIENNKLDEANKIIEEYEEIVKDDIEIVFFKSEISLKKLKTPSTIYKM